ncbi:MAG: hypothetical protein UIM24_05355 [Clostridia bacterium]|nr:hypothetical protein [Clostridia bacterium]
MSQIYAVVGPINTAVRLSKLLEKNGIYSKVVHTPNSTGGCSYSILTDESGKELLISLSERYRIKKFIIPDSD